MILQGGSALSSHCKTSVRRVLVTKKKPIRRWAFGKIRFGSVGLNGNNLDPRVACNSQSVLAFFEVFQNILA